MRKHDKATVAMLTNSFDDQLSTQSSAPEDADDYDKKAFCFWSNFSFLAMNASNTCLLVGSLPVTMWISS